MEKKIDLANNNIMVLIDLLVDARVSALGEDNCPYSCESDKSYIKGGDLECLSCRDDYFDNMRQELLDKYLV